MASCTSNCDNQSFVGYSNSISLSIYHENSVEISVKKSRKPIGIKIKRDPNLPIPQFELVNAEFMNFTVNSQFLPNRIEIKSYYAALIFQLKPVDFNSDTGYILLIKKETMPIVNSTDSIYDYAKCLCPNSGNFNFFLKRILKL
jgi:hypothetical protein